MLLNRILDPHLSEIIFDFGFQKPVKFGRYLQLPELNAFTFEFMGLISFNCSPRPDFFSLAGNFYFGDETDSDSAASNPF